MLRIVALSDIHGAYGEVERILVRTSPCDVILLVGDLTTFGDREEATGALRKFARRGRILGVTGNMDPPPLDDVFVEEGVSINGRGVLVGDIGFCGVSAAPFSPLHTPHEISEQEIASCAERGWEEISDARIKIFVPHAPPYGTRLDVVRSGRHVGSTAVRTFIEAHRPDLTLCGHIHEARGEDHVGGAQVVNCGPAGRGHHVTIEVGESLTVLSV